MSFKFIEKKISNINDATIFNFIFSFLFWIAVGLVEYFFYWIEGVKIFGSYYIYLFFGIGVAALIFKSLVLKVYKTKFIPILIFVAIPFVLYCLFFLFILLWNSASFVGPTIL